MTIEQIIRKLGMFDACIFLTWPKFPKKELCVIPLEMKTVNKLWSQ